MSRATREVLRAGRKAPWRLLASTAPLGLECNGEEHSQTQEGAQEVGGRPMSMWQLLLTRLTSVRATPTQHPLHRCLLPASCLPGAGRLSCPFPSFQTLGCLPSFLRGPMWNRTARSCLPEAPGTPSVCQQPPLSPSLSLRVFIEQRFGRGEPAALHLLKRRHCAWGPGPHGPRRAGRVTPVCTSVSAFSLLRVHRLVGRCVSRGGGVGPRVLWVQLRQEASLWAPPVQLTVWLPEDSWK